MAVTVMRDTIVCPHCKNPRVVTARQRRRAASTEGGILCSVCRGIGETRAFNDGDVAWWLRRFGVSPPRTMTASAFVASGGAPADLVELAHDVFPP